MSNKISIMIEAVLLTITLGGAFEMLPAIVSVSAGLIIFVIRLRPFILELKMYWREAKPFIKKAKTLFKKESEKCEIPPPLESDKLKP